MKRKLEKITWTAVLIFVSLVVLIGGVEGINAVTKNFSASPVLIRSDNIASSDSEDGDSLNEQLYSVTHNRGRWLYDLMTISGKKQLTDSSNARSVFEAARDCGIISDYDEEEMYLPPDRLFVAQTMVKALCYPQREAEWLSDVAADQTALSTMAYYGYFLPDENGMIEPQRAISAKEYEMLLTQLRRYRLLKGKRVLSFGDSIMYGTGNDGVGIADLIAEKYGMTASDYAVPGATMGLHDEADHICDQLARTEPADAQADIILLNGGTNDMRRQLPLGDIATGYDMADAEEMSFTGGFEKTLWMLRRRWSGVPVVYIRVHNMDIGTGESERMYGERGLEIAQKWGADTVDLYSDTAMNAEDASVCERYTYCSPHNHDLPDSIHPNAAGYARFYLPLISEAVENRIKAHSKE